MNWVSKLSGAIIALMLISFVAPDAQAGEGMFSRLRSKICKAKCPPAPTCEELCIQKCLESYCKRVKFLEQFRCTKPDIYKLGMYLAKTGYCLCVRECRNPCPRQAVAMALVVGEVDPEQCRINYENCVGTFAAWQNGLAGEPEPTTPCIDMYFECLGLKPVP